MINTMKREELLRASTSALEKKMERDSILELLRCAV